MLPFHFHEELEKIKKEKKDIFFRTYNKNLSLIEI
jgi:hypothetical protein